MCISLLQLSPDFVDPCVEGTTEVAVEHKQMKDVGRNVLHNPQVHDVQYIQHYVEDINSNTRFTEQCVFVSQIPRAQGLQEKGAIQP